MKKDKPIKQVNINSIADSLCSPLHMDYSFSICKSVIDRMINVSDNDLIKAMKFMYENFKLILEPACVAGIAALLGPLKNKLVNQNTVIILCGSNMDLKTWNNIIAKI